MKSVTSPRNPNAQAYRSVANGKRKDLFLVEGRHLLYEAIHAKWPLKSVFIRKDLWSNWSDLLEGAEGVGEVHLASPDLMATLSTLAAPEGVMALAHKREYDWPKALPGDLFLYLDAVQDPVNAGILVRSAMAFGLAGVFAGRGTADPYRLTALFRSAGAAFHIPIWFCSIDQFLEWSRVERVSLVAANARGTPLEQLGFSSGPSVLVMGNEGRGLSMELLTHCPRRVAIPMSPGWDSLNVAAAGSLLMYAFSRGRR